MDHQRRTNNDSTAGTMSEGLYKDLINHTGFQMGILWCGEVEGETDDELEMAGLWKYNKWKGRLW